MQFAPTFFRATKTQSASNSFLRFALLLCFAGAACATASELDYFSSFRSQLMYGELACWFSSIVLAARHLYKIRSSKDLCIEKVDIRIAVILTIIGSVLYLTETFRIPWQITSDEIRIFKLIKDMWCEPYAQDALGMCRWWSFPSGAFIIYAHLCQALGGISIPALRLISSFVGLLVVPFAYLYFRVFSGRSIALGATVILMFNSSLIHFSRMCDPQASCVVIELIALSLLLVARQRNCLFLAYVGGVVAGLGYYTIYPSRLVVFIWCGFVVGLMVFQKLQRKSLFKLWAVSLFAFAITLCPMIIHCCAKPQESSIYTRMRMLACPEGLELQRDHFALSTHSEAFWSNVKSGLVAFNSREMDTWGLYENPYIGIVDPFTGIFLWVGIAAVFISVRFKRSCPEEILQASAFLVMFLIMTFVTNLAPAYSRLLSTLPFVSYLAVRGVVAFVNLVALGLRVEPSFQRSSQPYVISAFCLVSISVNVFAYYLFCCERKNDATASIARYILGSANKRGHAFYLLMSHNDFYSKSYCEALLSDGQSYAELIFEDKADPWKLIEKHQSDRFFTFFMSRPLWNSLSSRFKSMFPNASITPITQDSDFVAVEVSKI